MALTYFFSWLAPLPGVLAAGLGFAARSEESTREMGNVAVVLGLVALLLATVILVDWLVVG